MESEPSSPKDLVGLPPPDVPDPVVEVYKRDVDRTLLRENLKLSPHQRAEQLRRFLAAIGELRAGEQRMRQVKP